MLNQKKEKLLEQKEEIKALKAQLASRRAVMWPAVYPPARNGARDPAVERRLSLGAIVLSCW